MIVVVDDNSDIRELLEAVLSASGYDVRCASGGEDALTLLESQIPALMLLDLSMPGMSGYQTLEHMRKRFPDHDIPVILVSAYPPEEEREQAMRMGVRDYISKPFQIPDLLKCVQAHLQRTGDRGRMTENKQPLLTSDS